MMNTLAKTFAAAGLLAVSTFTMAAAKSEVIAKAEGERKKALERALEFKKMGLPIADIAEGTGLSIDEIEKIK